MADASRARRAPELGPRILFLSGGSALQEVSRALKQSTHNSIHLITPFDSGGSSARLRKTFRMLSVGDLRNRLMALADETLKGNPEIYRLFAHRFPLDGDPDELLSRLEQMSHGTHPPVADVPEPLRQIVSTHLRVFRERMPGTDFDLRGASIGNLILAAGYLHSDGHIDSAIDLFSTLVRVRGIVRPIVEDDLHLAAELEDGSTILGQHRLTCRDGGQLPAAVRNLFLVRSLDQPERAECSLADKTRKLIQKAELVCFPMGSFYSSVAANLLPKGVGSALRALQTPKVFVANTQHDPEQRDMTLADAVETLILLARRDAGEDTAVEEILNLVLVDTQNGSYEIPLELKRIRSLGIKVVDTSLVSAESAPKVDPETLSQILVSLV